MNFVFDENTSQPLVDFMKRMGAANIWHLTEFFPEGTKDPEFLPWIAERNYVLVTCDRKMRKAHKDVLEKHRVKALFLPREYAEKLEYVEKVSFVVFGA